MSGTLIRITPTGMDVQQLWHPNSMPNWETISTLVGGSIERVRVRYDHKMRDAYVDEEGLRKAKPINRIAMAMLADPFTGSTILGNLVIWVPDPKVKK